MEPAFTPNTAGFFALTKHAYICGWTDWHSRATRREFWLGGLGIGLSILPLYALLIASMDFRAETFRTSIFGDNFAMYTPLTWGVYILLLLLYTIPCTGLTVRRFHDIGRSGWWYFLFILLSWVSLINLVVTVAYFLFLCKDSVREENQWGISPKYGAPMPPVPPAPEA